MTLYSYVISFLKDIIRSTVFYLKVIKFFDRFHFVFPMITILKQTSEFNLKLSSPLSENLWENNRYLYSKEVHIYTLRNIK